MKPLVEGGGEGRADMNVPEAQRERVGMVHLYVHTVTIPRVPREV
jgi:hypothetical protein